MTAHEVDEISSLLGELKGRLTVIERVMEHEAERARKHREGLYVTISAQASATRDLTVEVKALNERVGRLEPLANEAQQRIAPLTARVERLEPVADEARSWRDQFIGASRLAGLLWFVGGAIGATLIAIIGLLLRR